MKWIFTALLLFACLIGFRAFAIPQKQNLVVVDKYIWRNLYGGDMKLAEKWVWNKTIVTTNDALMQQFMMLYMYHRLNDQGQVEGILSGIDSFVEEYYLRK